MASILALLAFSARAQSTVPDREIPASVLGELGILSGQFEHALAADCASRLCFPKGCTYVDHAVADRPRGGSLPGLGQDPGPGSVDAQEYLTRARCSFAVEDAILPADASALSRRLQSKLSRGWLVVSVDSQRLPALPPALLDAPPEPEPEAAPPPAPPPPSPPEWSPLRELWSALLPHFWWMIGVGLVSFAAAFLIWAWRRVGADSIEDRMLLAELGRENTAPPPAPEAPPPAPVEAPADVSEREAAWRERLAAADPTDGDAELRALVEELLRSGEKALLAKAMLRFPDGLLRAFPSGGDFASAKLELSDYLKAVDPASLPADADFFQALDRHALAASVAAQPDARVVRSLREDFGASGLAEQIGRLPARSGALLFALAPREVQHELVRLLEPRRAGEIAGMLLRSNRMDPAEAEHLFAVVSAAREGRPPPSAPAGEVSDRGVEIDAAGALSVLIEGLRPDRRDALFAEALDRFHGNLPAWQRGILYSDLLASLPGEARADLLLGLEVEPVAAWLSLLDPEAKGKVLAGLPSSLRNSIRAVGGFASRAGQLALAERGRRALAKGLVGQLAREGRRFEEAVLPTVEPEPADPTGETR